MNLFGHYYNNFRRFSANKAFCFDDKTYTYNEFFVIINNIRNLLESDKNFSRPSAIGIICYDDVYTYASIFAVWFSGCCFIPLNPSVPQAYNQDIINRNKIKVILASGFYGDELYPLEPEILFTHEAERGNELPLSEWIDSQVAYVLHTSGSTGEPKHVPITLKNLTAFIGGFLAIYPELNETDTFLQTYDLTADAAFTGYLIPFYIGAAVYTLPRKHFKPFATVRVLTGKPITWVQVTPSLLACLVPYFSSLDLPHVKHFHFGGEALPANLTEMWRNSVPNAEISNVYGPTETTITTTIYKCLPGEPLKSFNNVVSIGKPLKGVKTLLKPDMTDEAENRGELLIAGEQVMEGYLFSGDQPFEFIGEQKGVVKFYPTGDLVKADDEGYLYYLGRLNDQVKINGYRVDLIEVENTIRELFPVYGNVAAATVEISEGLSQLVVFVENLKAAPEVIKETLKDRLPVFKIPEKIVGVESFPFLPSGKTDKKTLVKNYLISLKNGSK